ncbi:homocysteine S-methyltransferase family protein [Bacteroidota bacterium]
MIDLFEKIKSQKILLADGAWGTMLFEKGLQQGECPELWNITNKERVFDIAKQYVAAGSDIVETNSFGGSVIKLEHYNLGSRTEEINIEAANISREAAGNEKLVFGSMGPCGKILIMGDVTEDQIYDSFSLQAKSLVKGGSDALIIETMTALDEALIAIRACKENTSVPIICTFTFDKTINNDYRTMMGISPEEMCKALISAGVDVVGSNCGNGFDGMIEIAKELRKISSKIPIMIQANAGMPELVEEKVVYPEKPDEMAEKIPALINLGVSIIGGCCGTTPAHISKFSQIINQFAH